jgi:DNA-binding transcriptional ArsR family regulator
MVASPVRVGVPSTSNDLAVSKIAAAIGEPARARILFALMDDRARSSTELAALAGVSPSTASAHLHRLTAEHLIKVLQQGKHRYYSLNGRAVAVALEALSVLSTTATPNFHPSTPTHLRAARTCYDHLAGTLGVALHDRLTKSLGWLAPNSADSADVKNSYRPTAKGRVALHELGIDVDQLLLLRRRFASPCLDWSERRPHLAGSLAAALLQQALKRKWLSRESDSRSLIVTGLGRRELQSRFGLVSTPQQKHF